MSDKKGQDMKNLPLGEKKLELAGSDAAPGLAPPQEKKLVSHEEQKLLGKEHSLEHKVREIEERLIRLQAEFDNFRKRAAKENEMLRKGASADSLMKLLPILDEFEIAMSHVDKASAKDFKHGMELIYSKLIDMMKKEGVEPVDALGERFDPYKHDALREGEGEEGKIVEVVQKGYTYKGDILRHAKVVVGKRAVA
jgi:molecular chaperone GrpE